MSPRRSHRTESEQVSLKYCFFSAWLLSSFPDFYLPSRLFVNVYCIYMQVFSLFSPFFSILVYAGALVRCHKGSVLILLILQRRLLGTGGGFYGQGSSLPSLPRVQISKGSELWSTAQVSVVVLSVEQCLATSVHFGASNLRGRVLSCSWLLSFFDWICCQLFTNCMC